MLTPFESFKLKSSVLGCFHYSDPHCEVVAVKEMRKRRFSGKSEND